MSSALNDAARQALTSGTLAHLVTLHWWRIWRQEELHVADSGEDKGDSVGRRGVQAP